MAVNIAQTGLLKSIQGGLFSRNQNAQKNTFVFPEYGLPCILWVTIPDSVKLEGGMSF